MMNGGSSARPSASDAGGGRCATTGFEQNPRYAACFHRIADRFQIPRENWRRSYVKCCRTDAGHVVDLNQEHAVVRTAEMRPMGPGIDTGDLFDAGSLCLDFIAALQSRRGDRDDRASEASRLAEWLRSRGLPEPTGGLTERDLDDAGALCASIDALARSLLSADLPVAEDIGRLNATGRDATPVFLMQAGGGPGGVLSESD